MEDEQDGRGRAPVAVIVMGVSGCGKTTVARLLAEQLGRPMLEGDDMHSPESVSKMRYGVPLTDGDRWPWLRRIRSWIVSRPPRERPSVVACSALRRPYRDLLAGEAGAGSDSAGSDGADSDRAGSSRAPASPSDSLPPASQPDSQTSSGGSGSGSVIFVYLHVGRAELHRRLASRSGHFMKAGMLDSQLSTLEPPQPDENAVTVDAAARPDLITAEVLRRTGLGG